MKGKYYIKTFGCAMNRSDSERIAAILEKNSFKPVSNINEASLVVFNTCGVRQMAEDRVYGQIHNIGNNESRIMNYGVKKKIILTGCLANRKDVQRRLKDKVDLFFPINDLKLFENWITQEKISNFHPPAGGPISNKISNSKSQISNNFQNSKFKIQNSFLLDKENIAYLSINPKHNNAYQALVPIMTGCNNFCAYCVVPHARGREVSRPAEEIIKEVKNLAEKGCKHIILLGQNVNSYQFIDKNSSSEALAKEDNSINFPHLLKKINALPGKFWISFMSNHPKDVTDEMIETVARCKKVCECFHLPIQSGNDEIIQKMNRKYTAKQYLKLVKKIKATYGKNKPGTPYAITSDIIVGFPGETKKQFLDSAEIMEKVKYDMVFFGQYSPRPGTAAWKMTDNVSKTEKVRRETYLNEILKKTALANNKKYIGKTLEVLIEQQKVESSSSEGSTFGIYFGKTRTMKNVKITSSKKNLVGKIMQVKIIKANIWNLEACLPKRQRKIK